jgi:nucleoid-associated protein YgaU
MRRSAESTSAHPGGWPRRLGGAAAALAVLAGLAAGGCGTGGLAVKRDVWEAQDDFERRQAGLSEKVLQMEGRITALEEALSAMQRQFSTVSGQVSELDTDFSRGLEAIRDGQQQLGIELEGRIRNVDDSRKTDRDDTMERFQIVLDEVTAENQRLREEIEAIKSAVSVGFSHTVQRGETLASIASKYGVTVQEIATANDITNPNLISVGQELFIPQR